MIPHIVEAVLDGIPSYIKEDYPKFVALCKEYYTWMSSEGKALDLLYTHEQRIDVDSLSVWDSILRELGADDVPPAYRRQFIAHSRSYYASQGSIQSFHDFFRIFYSQVVKVEDGARSILIPSAARVEKYQRCILVFPTTSFPVLKHSGVIKQAGGATADVVMTAVMEVGPDFIVVETVVKPRQRVQEFFDGAINYLVGEQTITCSLIGYLSPQFSGGQGYAVGDGVTVKAFDYVTNKERVFTGVVASLAKVLVTAVTVQAPGQGYVVGDAISISGYRGFQAEVSKVTPSGGVVAARVLDVGDPFDGPLAFEAKSIGGTSAVLSTPSIAGRPQTIKWDVAPFGELSSLIISSSTGSGQTATATADGHLFEKHQVITGFNGVIGVGSTITDSDAWMDGSYLVKTAVPSSQWMPGVKKTLHPAGRQITAVKTHRASAPNPVIAATSTIRQWDALGSALNEGQAHGVVTLT